VSSKSSLYFNAKCFYNFASEQKRLDKAVYENYMFAKFGSDSEIHGQYDLFCNF